METLNRFSSEVCSELKYYVYRLVDPRNGQTFYVGKGKNNRVFSHAECALTNCIDTVFNDQEDEEDLKYKTIREIKESGLDVIYIIQKYGLTQEDAFKIESVLIDAYSIDKKLTNKIRGFNASEPQNAITLQRDLSAIEYADHQSNPKYMIIKVKEYLVSQRGRYDCTRSAWKIKISEARKYPYVLSVTDGIVKAVYKVSEWHNCPTRNGRIEFTGVEAEQEIKDLFLYKKIPAKYRKQGLASPVLYGKLDENE